MGGFQDQPAALRWIARTVTHAIDGNAWIGSLVAAFLAAAWVLQSQLGVQLPGNLSKQAVDAIGYWSGRASILVVLVVLVQAAARAGVEEGMDRLRRNPSHIQDLQNQAGVMRQYVLRPLDYPRIDIRSVSALNLFQHFPKVDAEVENWNHAAQEYRNALDVLSERHNREGMRPIEGTQATLAGVLFSAAAGTYSPPDEVVWRVDPHIMNLEFRDPKLQQGDISIGTIPPNADPLDFTAKVQRRIAEVREWPEATRYRESVQRLQKLRSGLDRLLEVVQLDHAPGGRCDTCRPPKSGR